MSELKKFPKETIRSYLASLCEYPGCEDPHHESFLCAAHLPAYRAWQATHQPPPEMAGDSTLSTWLRVTQAARCTVGHSPLDACNLCDFGPTSDPEDRFEF